VSEVLEPLPNKVNGRTLDATSSMVGRNGGRFKCRINDPCYLPQKRMRLMWLALLVRAMAKVRHVRDKPERTVVVWMTES
jgi:hypothetical protein